MPPKQSSTTSTQTVQTPSVFVEAIQRRFGGIEWDLAATYANSVGRRCYTRKENSLKQNWTLCRGLKYVNPPFKDMDLWSRKAYQWSINPIKELGTLLLLGPGGVETRWFRRNLFGEAKIHILVPRIQFVGHKNVFPKGLVLAEYGDVEPGIEYWDWKE